jgi:APA family basic amino acid/polyamine antiporter
MLNKLNIFTLSGLMIGPVLGTGIILLPPLIYDITHEYSLFIWGMILLCGVIFALIFAKLSIIYKGEEGASLATKKVLGVKYQKLTAFYLISAVCFGPVAVLLIGVEFIKEYFVSLSSIGMGVIVYLLIYLLLIQKIKVIGLIMLVATSLTSIILVYASVNILFETSNYEINLFSISYQDIGYAFLLAFWAIVGWEIIGNYSADVRDVTVIKKAVLYSSAIVTIIYILIASAVLFGDFTNKSDTFNLIWLLQPTFGIYSNLILTLMSLILSMGTLIMFIGGVARLISSLNLTRITSYTLKSDAPIGALTFLAIIHMGMLYLVSQNILNIDKLVAIADGFFIANAIIGLATAIKLFKKGFLYTCSYILIAVFFVILLFSNSYILFFIIGLFIYTYLFKL